MYDDILVPTDGSDTVGETLDHALPIAVANEATIHALSVVDTRITAAADGDSREEVRRSLEAECEEAVATVASRAADAGVESVSEIRHATPWKGILQYADDADVDLIAIGTHGKTPREKRTSMGSVSERVVDDAKIPVLVVRDAGGGEP